MTTFTVAIDWDNDGSFATAGDDISAYIDRVSWGIGLDGDLMRHVANVGYCILVVGNQDRRFSPLNAAGPYYGKLIPNLKVRIQAIDGVNTHTVFYGVVRKFQPTAGIITNPKCMIECEDYVGVLQRARIKLPLQENQTSDYLIRLIAAYSLNGATATGRVDISAAPDNNDTVTIGNQTYTFKTTLGSAANQILIGSTGADSASRLARAINASQTGYGSQYTAATLKHDQVTAWTFTVGSSGTVFFRATSAGTWGNSLSLSVSGTNLSVNYPMQNGTDGDAALALETGTQTFEYVGDLWVEQTNVLTAIEQVTDSEYGFFWAARDGTLTFKNKDWMFEQFLTASSAAISDGGDTLEGDLCLDDIVNRFTVSFQVREAAAQGVVAQAKGPIRVPGNVTGERYNATEDIEWDTSAGSITVILPFTDPETGQQCGAADLVLPLVATTDYTINDMQDGSGFNYTTSGNITFSVAVVGSGVEVSMSNTATGPLWVRNLQVRGNIIQPYNSQATTFTDSASRVLYGIRELTYDLALPSIYASDFAYSLAQYTIGKYKDPAYRLRYVEFTNRTAAADGTALHELEIGDLITISDNQMAVASRLCIIAGIRGVIEGPTQSSLGFVVRELDDVSYWILDDITYSVLDSTTRTAL